jgi:hypothetical protein
MGRPSAGDKAAWGHTLFRLIAPTKAANVHCLQPGGLAAISRAVAPARPPGSSPPPQTIPKGWRPAGMAVYGATTPAGLSVRGGVIPVVAQGATHRLMAFNPSG